jgi:thiamine monophosphate kinase
MLASEILNSPIIVGTQPADYTNKVVMINVSDIALKGASFAVERLSSPGL